MKHPWITFVFCLAVLLATACSSQAQTWTSVDFPVSDNAYTDVMGVSGSTVIGNYFGPTSSGMFTYDTISGNYTTLTGPPGNPGAYLRGIDGNSLVGYTGDGHSFYYDGSSYTILSGPVGANLTNAQGISGNSIVGNFYGDDGVYHSFLYNVSSGTYNVLSDPLGATGTVTEGISGNLVVGYYTGGSADQMGFLYDLNTGTFTDISNPLATSAGTVAMGISNGSIVGYYGSAGAHSFEGFVYDINTGTYTTLSNPDADPAGGQGTIPTGISGGTVVGYYDSNTGGTDTTHGFAEVAAVPEPSGTVLVLGLCGLVSLRRRR